MIRKRIYKYCRRVLFHLLYNKSFGFLSPSALVYRLLRIDNSNNIFIMDRVVVQKYSWLAAVPVLPDETCRLEIGEGSIIGHFNHIYATKEIIIGKNVLIADKVFISDSTHVYRNIYKPVKDQPLEFLGTVKIGDGAWIGENVCVLGCSIGRNSIIGSNSVVKSDIPDYCVAIGSPARIVKRYNLSTKAWEKV